MCLDLLFSIQFFHWKWVSSVWFLYSEAFVASCLLLVVVWFSDLWTWQKANLRPVASHHASSYRSHLAPAASGSLTHWSHRLSLEPPIVFGRTNFVFQHRCRYQPLCAFLYFSRPHRNRLHPFFFSYCYPRRLNDRFLRFLLYHPSDDQPRPYPSFRLHYHAPIPGLRNL